MIDRFAIPKLRNKPDPSDPSTDEDSESLLARLGLPEVEAEPGAAGAPTFDSDETDLAMRNTPWEWFEAESQSPQDLELAKKRIKKQSGVHLNPRRVSTAALFLSGLVAILITVPAWASAEILGLFGSSWLAVPAGLLIALIVRAGCGRNDAQGRGTIASIAYLLTLLIVLGFLTRREIHEIYGGTNDVVLLEQNLFRRRFNTIDQLISYVVGWAVTWFASIWLRH